MRGRGRRIILTALGLVVMILHYLRRYTIFCEGADLFGLPESTYEDFIKKETTLAFEH